VVNSCNEKWVEVRSYNNMYLLTILERETMKQEVVANAEAEDGKVKNRRVELAKQ
jgi:hypothetical protein